MKAGRIVAQTPRAGARLAVGARVHLTVSKGKRR
jgi:beta-lactam-binding protein with PASTA domain